MQIRKGLNTDLVRLECCDFSFTISHIAREPFIHCDLHIDWFQRFVLPVFLLLLFVYFRSLSLRAI